MFDESRKVAAVSAESTSVKCCSHLLYVALFIGVGDKVTQRAVLIETLPPNLSKMVTLTGDRLERSKVEVMLTHCSIY